GYSLITTEVTRVQASNVAKPNEMKAPTGQFGNVAKYPPANFRLVSAPNADTLYSFAWLDLSEPQVFSHPDMGDRFYFFEVVDLWMSDSESSPSKRRSGVPSAYPASRCVTDRSRMSSSLSVRRCSSAIVVKVLMVSSLFRRPGHRGLSWPR